MMERFYKTEDCPASEKLAALRNCWSDSDELRRHLSACEFCAAEMDFYRHHPPVEEDIAPSNIPEPLFELADALMHKRRDLTDLYKLADKKS